MTLDPIAVLPAIASIAVIYAVSVEAALYRVYLPVLLLLPDNFWWGWPPLCFHQYAIFPIGLVLCWWVIDGKWTVSWMDAAVFGFIGWMMVSDYHNNGTVDIANRLAAPITLAVFPYMAGKLLIEQTGFRIATARRFAFFLFIDVILSVWEFRMGVNPFRFIFSHFFSTTVLWFTQIRYGVGRISGPFGHAIFMGAIVAVAILLHGYAMHFGLWEKRFQWLPHWYLNKSWVMLCGLVAGSIMTVSRGPWLAAVVGAMVAAIGTSQNRWRALRRTLIILIVGGAIVYVAGKAYVAGSKSYGDQEAVASATYRTELLDEYGEIALQRSFWGWGSLSWPRVPGMASVDDWYLLVALMYGVTGLVLFSLMLVVAVFRLLRNGMLDKNLAVDQRALIFTMGGIIVAIAVAIATVFLGAQLYPILFLFLGWSDACLVYRPGRMTVARGFVFRRVIA